MNKAISVIICHATLVLGIMPLSLAQEVNLDSDLFEIIYEQDFEDSITGDRIPNDVWDDSAWAGSAVPLRIVEQANEHYLEADISGFAQLMLGKLPKLHASDVYRIRVRLRSYQLQHPEIYIRQMSAPYTMYISNVVPIDEQMREVSVMGRMPETSENAILMLKLQGVTQLQIDSLIVERLVGELPPGAQPSLGNQVINGSFELGSDAWLQRDGARVEKIANAHHGSRVAVIPGHGFPGAMSTLWMRLSYESDYIVRMWVRAVDGPATIRAELLNAVHQRGGELIARNVTDLSTNGEWQLLEMTARPKPPAGHFDSQSDYYLSIWNDSINKGLLQVDNVEIQPYRAEPNRSDRVYQSYANVERAIRVGAPRGVVTEGASIELTALSTAATDSFELIVLDESDQEHSRHEVQTIDGEAKLKLNLPCGYWRLTTKGVNTNNNLQRSESLQATRSTLEGEAFVSVVPPMPDTPIVDWEFGAHIHPDSDIQLACWKLGIRWNRLHDVSALTKWYAVQPEPDIWTFDRDDLEFRLRLGHGILGVVDLEPAWVHDLPGESQPGSRYNDEQLDRWKDYVSFTVRSASPGISHWEITNESSTDHSPQGYTRLANNTVDVIRAENPSAFIVGLGGPLIGSDWTRDAILAGAARGCNAVSFHGYGISLGGTAAGPEPLIEATEKIRHTLAEAGNPDAEIWNTEAGFVLDSASRRLYQPRGGTPAIVGASIMAKSVAAAKAAGIDKTFYYAAHDRTHPSSTHSVSWMIEIDGSMHIATQPMAVAISLLQNRDFIRRRSASKQPDLVHLIFRGQTDDLHMVWANSGSISFRPSQRLAGSTLNMWGRSIPETETIEITEQPIYYRTQSAVTAPH